MSFFQFSGVYVDLSLIGFVFYLNFFNKHATL